MKTVISIIFFITLNILLIIWKEKFTKFKFKFLQKPLYKLFNEAFALLNCIIHNYWNTFGWIKAVLNQK